MSEISEEIDAVFAPALSLSEEDRHAVVAAMTAWVRARVNVGDEDTRLRELLRSLPEWAKSLHTSLDEKTGLRVTGNRTCVLLERGASWLRGGDWQSAVLSSVGKETESTL